MTGGYWWLLILVGWGLALIAGCWLDYFLARRRERRWYLPSDVAVYRPRAYVDQRGETPDPRQDLPAMLRRQAE